ncbi:hypothetical protein HY994_00885 [Candidatus Micrarchaeota archaeon]|nr:hypothetical protein [Candidatus Micrarchaeota archaeon]
MTSKRAIDAIRSRNARVEADKAWETSWTRRLIIAAITYILASALLVWIRAPQPFLAALVPTLGYVLSTLTLPFAKQYWLENIRKK